MSCLKAGHYRMRHAGRRRNRRKITSMTVYIMTRDRLDNLRKIIPRWQAQRIPVVLVVELEEVQMHREFVNAAGFSDIRIIATQQENRGIGHKRRFAVIHAKSQKLRSIIMSDDDMRPANGAIMHSLLRQASKPSVLGIGAIRSIHDRFTGGALSRRSDVILCPGGWGFQLFALNIDNTMSVGNFNSRLDCYGEDAELMRLGISNGIPWLVHCGVRSEPLGKRYDPGGMNAYISDGTRLAREQECRRIIHERWPQYTSSPEAKPRMQWQKMLNDYIPGWKGLSALHGGRWVS